MTLFEIPSAVEGSEQGDLIGVFKISADGNAVSESGHANAERGDQLGKVHRRRFALNIGVRGNDKLPDLAASDAVEQFLDPQIRGCHAVHGRNCTAQNMVHTVVFLDLFQRHDGLGVLYDADHAVISLFIGADRAKGLVAEIAANLTGADVLLGIDNGAREGFDLLLAHAENGKGVADRRFSADTGKTAKFLDEFLQRKNVFRQRSIPSFLKTDRGSRTYRACLR